MWADEKNHWIRGCSLVVGEVAIVHPKAYGSDPTLSAEARIGISAAMKVFDYARLAYRMDDAAALWYTARQFSHLEFYLKSFDVVTRYTGATE